MKEHVFVYGTLRREGGHDLEKMFCDVRFVSEGEFSGEMVLVDYYPGVVDSEDPKAKVLGEIYEIEGDKKYFRELDVFEDFRPHEPRAGEYRREKRNIRLSSGVFMEAWIYIYNGPTHKLQKICSGDFLQFLRETVIR